MIEQNPEAVIVGLVAASCVLYGIAYWLRRVEEAADDA